MSPIGALLHDLLNRQDLDIDDAARRHVTDDYRQRTDGEWTDRSEFLDHMRHLRDIVDGVEIDVLDEITDGRTYADRHVVHLAKRDGSSVTQEVYLFGDLAEDGRFSRIEETTMMLDGAEDDRAIGSAR